MCRRGYTSPPWGQGRHVFCCSCPRLTRGSLSLETMWDDQSGPALRMRAGSSKGQFWAQCEEVSVCREAGPAWQDGHT